MASREHKNQGDLYYRIIIIRNYQTASSYNLQFAINDLMAMAVRSFCQP